ncbi:MAG: hypothetical protein Q4A66_04020 [Eubacteriales bacterium]|nr:hypothetical protein [Eubacteriales bacterium]
MNKNAIYLISMLVVLAALFLFRMTGLTAHIVLSVIGLVLSVVFTAATRKEWTMPALEIAMRVLFVLAFISGLLLVKGVNAPIIGVLHKVFPVLFAVLLVALNAKKAFAKKA